MSTQSQSEWMYPMEICELFDITRSQFEGFRKRLTVRRLPGCRPAYLRSEIQKVMRESVVRSEVYAG